jgi:hypothetical protein
MVELAFLAIEKGLEGSAAAISTLIARDHADEVHPPGVAQRHQTLYSDRKSSAQEVITGPPGFQNQVGFLGSSALFVPLP